MLKLIPFNAAWVTHAKMDLKAIYRRPRWVHDEFDEMVLARDADGLPLWDITTPLRVLDHNKHTAKGFEYVTLATRDDLVKAAQAGTVALAPGMTSWRDYLQHQTGGPWNQKKYVAGQKDADTAAVQQLKADVEKYGPEAVEELRRRSEPAFTLPETMKPKRARAEKAAVA